MRREAKWCVMGLALAVLSACQTNEYAALNESDFQIAPMVERRDTLTATGYSVIDVQTSEYPAQRRLLAIRAAKLDAYRALTEQVYGQYIDATTTVA